MDDEKIISDDALTDKSTKDAEEVDFTKYSKQKKQIVNRRKNKFKESWKNDFNWLAKANEETMAKCFVCAVCFSIANGCISDIKRDMRTARHLRNLGSYNQKSVSHFFNQSSNNETEIGRQLSSMAEAAFVYHTIIHSHSYQSADCSSKLFKLMFPDSNVASNFTCGKTKLSKITTNILAKYSIETILKDLADDHPFSISTDASNKGNVKTFPIVLRYFSKHTGVNTKLFSFYESNSEMSNDIAECLKSKLEARKLNLANVISFCADNANVNFGCKKSVCVELKKSNPDIIGMGCLCHIINNAFKNALKLLKLDVENIVIKVFNEFSSSTKKTSSLKEIFEFCDLEWSEMLRHLPTRRLSLTLAVERFLKNYPSIKTYFISLDSCPAALEQFFDLDTSEAYLGFVHNTGTALLSSIKKLEEKNNLVIIDIYKIVEMLRDKLEQQKNEKFYGYIGGTVCSNSDSPQEVSLFQKRADAVLSYVIKYIEDRFDLKNNKLEKLNIFNLNSEILFQDFTEVVNLFSIKTIDIDLLFDEFIFLKTFSKNVQKEKNC